MMQESTWADWPINGPRTALWVGRFCLENGHTPNGMHTAWRQQAKLTQTDQGVTLHETVCKALHYATTYDQLNIGELASMEVLARGLQMTQYRWRDRLLGVGQNDHDSESHYFFGTDCTRGSLCVSPALNSWLGAELQKEALAAKEQRKAREERVLKRGEKPPKT